ncbi:MAG: hypothetical protein COS34_01560 [Lysobacterales bacterium CG02_land_8_20_14_3_00_62_12]|nr:MAG: hypothetical protein COS34_01560 [Xanthomonadales bacterium CG02_land_8_20_14_3_00_62_12]
MNGLVQIALGWLLVLLAGCGFKPREAVELNPILNPLRIESVDAFSTLPQEIGRALLRSGIRLVDADETPASVLRVLADTQATTPLTFSGAARVQEYLVVHRVTFEVLDQHGKPILGSTVVERKRDYRFDESQALGAAAEDELARKELRREMVQALLLRLQAIGR